MKLPHYFLKALQNGYKTGNPTNLHRLAAKPYAAKRRSSDRAQRREAVRLLSQNNQTTAQKLN